jgi:hypothetical protein
MWGIGGRARSEVVPEVPEATCREDTRDDFFDDEASICEDIGDNCCACLDREGGGCDDDDCCSDGENCDSSCYKEDF